MPPRPKSASTDALWLKERLDTPVLLRQHLDALIDLDPRLRPIWARAGDVSLRTGQRGFPGLTSVICGQQLSTFSARAIWARVEALPGAGEPHGFLQISEADLRTAGLSGGKVQSMRGVAEAIVSGALDLAAIEDLPAETAIAQLTAVKGVGPWTAELYLLFCAGHPDIFPAGDLALKKAVRDGLGLGELPSTKELIEIAARWSPHRGAATLLFFRYFHALYDKVGVAV